MRVPGIVLATGTATFILVLGAFQSPTASSTASSQELLNEEGYAAAMKRIDLMMGYAAMNIDALYWDDLGDASETLAALFEQVQTFWTARQVPAAVNFSALAIAATHDLGQASGARSAAAANQAVGDLRSACRSCHSEFREKTDDGFRIKAGERPGT